MIRAMKTLRLRKKSNKMPKQQKQINKNSNNRKKM